MFFGLGWVWLGWVVWVGLCLGCWVGLCLVKVSFAILAEKLLHASPQLRRWCGVFFEGFGMYVQYLICKNNWY